MVLKYRRVRYDRTPKKQIRDMGELAEWNTESLQIGAGIVTGFKGASSAQERVTNRDYSPERLCDAAALKMVQRVRLIIDTELDIMKFRDKGNQLPPGKMEIQSRKGEIYIKWVNFPHGDMLVS